MARSSSQNPKSDLPPGFAEGGKQAPFAGDVSPAEKLKLAPYQSFNPVPRVRTKVGPGGRVVIPAAFRAAAGMEEGSEVTLALVGKEVRIITLEAALMRAQETVMKRSKSGASWVDELIADRIAEEKQDSADGI